MNEKHKLRYKVFRSILKEEYSDADIEKIMYSTHEEFHHLEQHLKSIIEKLKGENREVIVPAEQLNGNYIYIPKFMKLRNERYCYKQASLTKFNTRKLCQYRGKVIKLDQNLSYISDEKLVLSEMFPFINEEVSDSKDAFVESSVIAEPHKNHSSDIVTDTKILYSLDNIHRYREMSITIDDVREALETSGYSITVFSQDGQYLGDSLIESPLVKCDTIGKSEARLRISGESSDDGFMDEIDYFFEEVEGTMSVVYDDGTEEIVYAKKKYRDRSELIVKLSSGEDILKQIKSMKFKISTTNLQRQKNTFLSLIEKPSYLCKNLLKLTYDRSKFDNPEPVLISKYRFLTDLSRDGTAEQRMFVRKALATKDFMLLSGPPGTGKTMCIVEFVYQALRINPQTKILITASTHVAIDNVLERLYQEFGDDLGNFNIYPVRIGNINNITDDAARFSLEKIEEAYPEAGREYLRCANVVCGTAMGIYKDLSDYQNKDVNQDRFRFDYLIIDEASKTTLQEYIVPAVLCEKHILIGDINQLSPYTDTFLLEILLKSFPEMNQKLQDLSYYHFALNRNVQPGKTRMFVIDNSDYIVELSKWGIPDTLLIVSEEDFKLIYYGKNTVISSELYLKYKDFIPTSFEVYACGNLDFPPFVNIKSKTTIKEFCDVIERRRELSEDMIGGNWAHEVAWRYVRYHELRKVDQQYERELKWLIPDQIKSIQNDIDRIADITIPSILIKLQEGISTINTKTKNRLASGFEPEELKSRFVELKYQHRMHPDISKFAEESIYNSKLISASEMIQKRENIVLFPDRNIFVDVVNDISCKRENEREIYEITRILGLILDKSKDIKENFTVAILSFYKAQEKRIQAILERYLKKYGVEKFKREATIGNVKIEVYIVDKYQGKEAEITINTLTRNRGIGFMNVPNRINVALTRAKYYRIIVGDQGHYKELPHHFLRNIVYSSKIYKEGELK